MGNEAKPFDLVETRKPGERGPDSKPRQRRTRYELEHADKGTCPICLKTTKAGREQVDARGNNVHKDCYDAITAKVGVDKYYAWLKEQKATGQTEANPPEDEPEAPKPESKPEPKAEVKPSASAASGVTLETLDDDAPKAPGTTDLEALAFKVARQVSKQVLDEVYETVEKRTDAILARVNQLASQSKVAIAVRINDEPLRKLKSSAHPQLGDVVAFLKAGLTPLLVGPAGCGKTFVGEQAAEALGQSFDHLCFSAGVSETWLFGRQTPGGFVIGGFARAYRDGGVFLADEIDAADANLLLTINTALANGHLHNPICGETYKRHKDFHFIGAANTVGKGGNAVYTGRSRLDGATLDRFTIIRVDYGDKVEDALCPHEALRTKLRSLRAGMEKRGAAEIVSYRAFDKATRLKACGYSDERVIQTLAESWPAGLLKELGGSSPKEAK